MDQYTPPLLFKNPHIQSIVSSTGPRKLIVTRRAKALINDAETHILDCGKDIRLQGEYSYRASNTKGLVIMIHGWLGCNDSLYLLSAGQRLYQQGYNIFRLNLRDHGDTSHLNKELFNSTRIDEVVNAVKEIQNLFPHQLNFLCGFSLGGNFCLRVAARAPDNNIDLKQVIAVCPVINPFKTNRNLHEGLFIYHNYFQKKWQQALLKKLQHFPELGYEKKLKQLKTLDQMNDYFVPNHTAYDDVKEYLHGYAIGGSHMAQLEVPCHIISSEDDPVIMAEDLQELANNENLSIELTQYGGHCGYIEGISLKSWVDQRIVELFSRV